MKYKLIGCEVFARPAYRAAANSSHIIDMEFTKLRSHLKPGELRAEIQNAIDRSSAQDYDAILLGFGLCGNSTAGLIARSVPLVIPRAHDCCTVFLGSRGAFREHFGQTPSAQWNTACYYERYGGWYADSALLFLSPGQNGTYAELVEKYGEENAQYIWETLNVSAGIDFLTYIEVPEIADNGAKERFLNHASETGKEARILQGSTRLVDQLLAGEWKEEEFLIVPPGAEIKPVYDLDTVLDL
jgi:hypothetical protein